MVLRRFFFALFAIVLLGASSLIREPVVIATEAAYPPFIFTKKNGTLSGFDIDLAQAICTQQKLQCRFVNQPFDTLVPGLLARKFQVIIGAISATPARRKEVAFSEVYYQPQIGFIMEDSAHLDLTPEGLKDVNIGTQRGSVFENEVAKQFPQANLLLYATFEDALLDLQAGRVQIVVADRPILVDFTHRSAAHKYVIREGTLSPDLGAGFAIGFRRDTEGDTLREAFNNGISALKQSGEYDKLRKKWLI